MSVPEPVPFKPEWPDADLRFLRADLPEPPQLPLDDVFSASWAAWMRGAAASKGAPPDYVVASVLSVTASLIGNTRWPCPWAGWAEPPVVWSTIIGLPSAGKSPAMDAVLVPLKRVEREMREAAQSALTDWRAKAEVAKLAVILAGQPRGTLMARDELAGWLGNMTRYSGGSDRPFWLEAYGGRSFSVERMGRDPVYIDRLTIGVLGGIQPDRLRSLLIKSDDDGLLARFLPVWPNPAPVKRPDAPHDEIFLDAALRRLLSLEMPTDEAGHMRPWFVPFDDAARDLLDRFRQSVRAWEADAEGLLLSFIGKTPGLAVRLSLVLAMLEWATGEADAPQVITADHFGRAAHLVAEYFLPMARRAYAENAGGKTHRAARALAALIREEGWHSFTARDVRRKQRAHLRDMDEINPALRALETADLVRQVDVWTCRVFVPPPVLV